MLYKPQPGLAHHPCASLMPLCCSVALVSERALLKFRGQSCCLSEAACYHTFDGLCLMPLPCTVAVLHAMYVPELVLVVIEPPPHLTTSVRLAVSQSCGSSICSLDAHTQLCVLLLLMTWCTWCSLWRQWCCACVFGGLPGRLEPAVAGCCCCWWCWNAASEGRLREPAKGSSSGSSASSSSSTTGDCCCCSFCSWRERLA